MEDKQTKKHKRSKQEPRHIREYGDTDSSFVGNFRTLTKPKVTYKPERSRGNGKHYEPYNTQRNQAPKNDNKLNSLPQYPQYYGYGVGASHMPMYGNFNYTFPLQGGNHIMRDKQYPQPVYNYSSPITPQPMAEREITQLQYSLNSMRQSGILSEPGNETLQSVPIVAHKNRKGDIHEKHDIKKGSVKPCMMCSIEEACIECIPCSHMVFCINCSKEHITKNDNQGITRCPTCWQHVDFFKLH